MSCTIEAKTDQNKTNKVIFEVSINGFTYKTEAIVTIQAASNDPGEGNSNINSYFILTLVSYKEDTMHILPHEIRHLSIRRQTIR